MTNGEDTGSNGDDEYTEYDLLLDMIDDMDEEIGLFQEVCEEDDVEVNGFHYAFFMYSCLDKYCKELNIHLKDVIKAYKAAEKEIPRGDVDETG